MPRTTIDLDKELHERIRLHCFEQRESVAAFFRKAAEKYLEIYGKREGRRTGKQGGK